MANALRGIIAQELLPSTDRSKRVLAYEFLIATPSVRNVIREKQLHQLHNVMQLGTRDGMVLMDDCIHDLYCSCMISYDTAVSRAYDPQRIIDTPLAGRTESLSKRK